MLKVEDFTFNEQPVANADDNWNEFEGDCIKLLRKHLDKFTPEIIQESLCEPDECSVGFTSLYTAETMNLNATEPLPPLSVVLTVRNDSYLIDPIGDFILNITAEDIKSKDTTLMLQLSKFLHELIQVKQQVERLLLSGDADGSTNDCEK